MPKASSSDGQAILAFDLGSSHLKHVLVGANGRILNHGQQDLPTMVQGPAAEQDPLRACDAVLAALGQAEALTPVGTIAMSAAMHSFLVVDQHDRPCTRSWTWMDRRASHMAHHWRNSPTGSLVRQRTGVPIHAMSPWIKWLYYQSLGPLPAGARPVSLKDFIVHQLTGRWLTDVSIASASGFLALEGRWDATALQQAGLTAQQLPEVRAMTDPMACIGERRLVLGGSDGALSHVALAIAKDTPIGVLSLGTSAAIRVTRSHPVAVDSGLFCYAMGPDHGFLVGAAVSNGGGLLAWWSRLLQVSVDQIIARGLSRIERESTLPTVLPFLSGSRSPWWREDFAGALLQLREEHDQDAVLAAVLLSLGASLREGLDLLQGVTGPLQELRAASGPLSNPVLTQFIADALGLPLSVHDGLDASLWGAARLAAASTGEPLPALTDHNLRYLPRSPKITEHVAITLRLQQQAVAQFYLDPDRPQM